MENKQQASNEELPKTQTPEEGQVVIGEEEYKNLQSFATTVRQNEIALAIKLVTKDKDELLNISDKKLQNKVIKELYWYDNLEELQAIEWFEKEKEEDKVDNDELISVKQEVKILKYKAEKQEVDMAIKKYLTENNVNDEEVIDKIKEELKYISSSLDINERVKRAWKIIVQQNNLSMLSLQDKVVLWNWNIKKVEEKKNNEVDEIFSEILKSQKNKNEYKNRFIKK